MALLASVGASTAGAGMVTVTVTGHSGVSAADTVVVFDPLDRTPAPSHDSAVIDQMNKQFVPRVNVVRTGTSITFPNSDHIRHQVYSFSKPNVFTLKLYAGAPAAPVAFDHPGLVVLGCNIHDHMVAFVGVVDSPYFLKLSASGSATLSVPVGHYRMRVWHPNQITAIPLMIDLDPESTTVAAWPE